MDGIASPDRLREELLTLLTRDPDVRQAVLAIVGGPAAVPVPVIEPTPAPVPRVVPRPPVDDPLREQLSAQLALLTALRADHDLASAWLVDAESEGQQLARLLATAAQWERLLELWDVLAERCKQGSRPATAGELQILEGSLVIHNLIWRDRQARLCGVEAGAEYDYRLHQRVSLRGEVIAMQWLPGLANAGGERQRLPLATAQ